MPPRTRSGRTVQPTLVDVAAPERPFDLSGFVAAVEPPPCESDDDTGTDDIGYRLATCSFSAYAPSMGVAVQTSVGRARFFRHEPLERCGLVAPYGLLDVDDYGEFRPRYIDRLNLKAPEIAERFAEYGARHGRPLVLLCFEDLSKANAWCHRTILREWLQERTGLVVPELGPVR